MKKISLVLICLFCLNACSTKLAYNFLDIIGKWYVGQYVSLDRNQKNILDKSADEFHDWHRQTQLTIYADYIDHIVHALNSGKISGEWIHKETDTLQDLLEVSVTQAKPIAITLMASLSDEQSAEILKKLKKDRKKFKKKYIDVSEKKQKRNRKDDLLEYIAPFFGSFTKEQKSWIAEWGTQIKDYETHTLQQQEAWSNTVKIALEQRDNSVALRGYVDSMFELHSDGWDLTFQDILDYNQDISYNLIARLVNSQSEKQRKRTIKKLKSYKQDLLDLAGKS